MPIKSTKNWVEQFVLRHNLCPFAHQPHKEDRIGYHVCHSNTIPELISDFLNQCNLISENQKQTILIIYPDQFDDFLLYLDLVDILNNILIEAELEQHFQLASFHPKYRFEGSEEDDPANLSNRSPYAMVHILRCSDVEEAINSHHDTLSIPQRNIALLRSLF